MVPTKTITQKIAGTSEAATLPSSGWYNKEVEITVGVEDKGSGPDGYEYKINNGNVATIAADGWTKKTDKSKIQFNTEGRNVVVIRGLDVAGNTSTESTVEVKLDKTPPVFTETSNQQIQVTSVTTGGFTVTAQASDALSGSTAYNGSVTYSCKVTRKDNGTQVGTTQTNSTGTFNITE